MRQSQCTLSCKDVCGLAVNVLLSSLGLNPTEGRLGARQLVQLLVRMATERRSLEAIAGLAKHLPGAAAIRRVLYRLLPRTTAAFEPTIVEALHCKLPKSLSRRQRTMAIDLHTRPYYGHKNTPGIYRGQAKASTKNFFAYATLLVIRKGMTFTVALVSVAKGEELTTIVNKLLQQAASKGLKPRRLLLDRGFYAAKVMLALERQKLPFVIPMIRRGKSGSRQEQSTATAQFFVKGRNGWDSYTWQARMRSQGRRGKRTPLTTEVCMLSRGDKQTPLVYACSGLRHLTPKDVAALYKRRFRIETSYRQMHEGLALTCSKNAVYRLLLVLIAFVLRNLWLRLHWTVLAARDEDGKRVLRLELMRARTMMHWLVHYLDKQLGLAKNVTISNPAAAAA